MVVLPTTATFGDTAAFTGCEYFFSGEVLEHLQFHTQCQEKEVECKLGRELV